MDTAVHGPTQWAPARGQSTRPKAPAPAGRPASRAPCSQPGAALPRMELPPLSPGIQANVMDEAEVLDTVKRGWSGGTRPGRQHGHCRHFTLEPAPLPCPAKGLLSFHPFDRTCARS